MANNNKPLLGHQHALVDYLNDLLEEPVNKLTPSLDDKQNSQQTRATATTVDWRQNPFRALLFEVQGLKLLIPLDELHGIRSHTELTTTTNQPDGYLGVYSEAGNQTQVIDIAKMILPPSHQNNSSQPQFIITIADGKWGLACNKVANVLTLSPDQVNWRQYPGKRAWLAGTVLAKKCSILNIEELIKLF